jgi:NAD(P)-dependent dehydrogenase (short-subunit alcohol dehydrogenase family)
LKKEVDGMAALSTRASVIGAATAAAAGLAAFEILRRRPRYDLRGGVVLVTGGSRGLGLQLARDFAAQDCRVAICARDPSELQTAEQDLRGRGAQVWSQVCDVADRTQVDNLVRGAIDHFGRVDILVANAGTIQVGPVEQMRLEDFETAMNVMFWGVLYPIWSVLPHMTGRRSGRIVTITSIGGKVSVPHLLPYSCAKFAAVALSEGLRTELEPKGVKVHTIVPGLMRTGSHLNAMFKGRHKDEFRWFGLSASLPGMSMSVERASAQIVAAVRQGRTERILSTQANLLARFNAVFPELSQAILAFVNRLLLPSAEGGSEDLLRGKEIEARLGRVFQFLTALGRTAAARMNERRAEA